MADSICDEQFDIAVGEFLKIKRDECGKKQGLIAQELGYSSASTYCKIENGQRHIPRIKLVRLLKLLDSNIDELKEYLRREDIDPLPLSASRHDISNGADMNAVANVHEVDILEEHAVDALMQAAQEILSLAASQHTPLQQEATEAVLKDCLNNLQLIHNPGRILGNEDVFFKHILKRIHETDQPEKLKAYIRLTPFAPVEVGTRSWFETFYIKLEEAVRQNKVEVEYIFLLDAVPPSDELVTFLSRFKRFARQVSIVSATNEQLSPQNVRPNVTLFSTQKIAITHDRDDNKKLVDVMEWKYQGIFNQLLDRYESIELISTPYFLRDNEQ
jgi:transcriptional regulator with XRE-family HTH domain